MSAILRNKKLIIIIVLAGIVAAVAWYFLRPAGTPPGLAYGNGRLEATETAVATKVQGKLIEVYFREGADLKTGQIAAQLDDAQLKADIRAAEAAVEQAKEYGHSLERELAFLAVHGALHLMGYDHMTPEEENEMVRRQKEILNKMGVMR